MYSQSGTRCQTETFNSESVALCGKGFGQLREGAVFSIIARPQSYTIDTLIVFLHLIADGENRKSPFFSQLACLFPQAKDFYTVKQKKPQVLETNR